MSGLLDLPEEVMRQHMFPQLGHNDLLRLRVVCKITNDFVTNYLWTPKQGQQGHWKLTINPRRSQENLKSFLHKQLPPPSRLQVNLSTSFDPRLPDNFFEDPNLEEFTKTYGKYITHLYITRIEIPFMSTNQIRFYESLVNLEHLECWGLRTGGAAQFQQKMETEGSLLLPSPFVQKLKSFKVDTVVDCTRSFTTFVLGLKSLERISGYDEPAMPPPFIPRDDHNLTAFFLGLVDQMTDDNKLKLIDWNLNEETTWNPRDLLRLFALCSDKGIKIKNLPAAFLQVQLCNNNGLIDKTEIFDENTGQPVYRVNYQRNSFIRNVVQSVRGLNSSIFLLEELPHLEEISTYQFHTFAYNFRIWRRHGEPNWPNLRKMDIFVDRSELTDLVNFLCGGGGGGSLERAKMEELALRYRRMYNRNMNLPLPNTLNMVRSMRNLRKLTLEGCLANSAFFVELWKGLALLEHVELIGCKKLGNNGFIGYSKARGVEPVFSKLRKLKHLSIEGIHGMTWFSDAAFREVFSRMKLKSLKLTGHYSGRQQKVTVQGIEALLTGEFAESIERFDFKDLHLDGLSEDGRRELVSRFRSSKML